MKRIFWFYMRPFLFPRSPLRTANSMHANDLLDCAGRLPYERSMTRVRILISLALITFLFPGTIEIIENTSHYVRFGHLSIFETDDHHSHKSCSEDGCTTSTHICGTNTATLYFKLTTHDFSRHNSRNVLKTDRSQPETLRGFTPLLYRPPCA